MKIVQVMPEFGLAGAEIMCEALTYELIKLGHEVSVISLFDYHSVITERLENSGVNVIYLDKKLGLDLSMIGKLKKVLKNLRPDVVHTHRYCAQYAIPAANSVKIKCRVHTLHSIAQKENGKLARILNKYFFKHNYLTPVALSPLIQQSIVQEYKLKKENIPVIFNGVDLSKCIEKKDYETNGNFKIVHVGRFAEPKNHIGLLKAFELFNKEYSDSELWLIGDGELRSEIEQYVKENDLKNSVKFLGLQEKVHQFLFDADIFTLPSNYEGIPMTIIEAMGTGLPIVATKVGGVPDMLEDKISALLVDNNTDAIANAFKEYYLDSEKRKEHGQNALKGAGKFSAKTMAEEYEKVYLSKKV